MSSTYISTVFIFCVALNPFSAAENNAHEEISRKEFEQMKNGMKMLLEKVQIQETRIIDLEMEIEVLKNGDDGKNRRTVTESRRQEGEVKQKSKLFKTHYLIYNETLHKVSLTITILKIYYLYLTTFLQLSI